MFTPMNKWTIRYHHNAWFIHNPQNIPHEKLDRRPHETNHHYMIRAYRIAWAHAATTNIFHWADR